VDRSRGSLPDVRDSVLALTKSARSALATDAIVLFDSSATLVTAGAMDSVRALSAHRSRGSLTAALVTARRAAADLSQRADSVELVIVSPLTTDELDAASAGILKDWPGRVRLMRTAAAPRTSTVITLVSGDADDALRPAIAALNSASGHSGTTASVRVLRAAPTAADSAAARDGAAIVLWSRGGSGVASAEGLWAGNATLVAPLERMALPQAGAAGRTVARWADGMPAASESPVGRGCLRTIGIGVPVAGDVTLQPAFVAVTRALLAPCDGFGVDAPVPDSVASLFARTGAAATAAALRPGDDRSPLAPWLLGAALILLVGELLARRGAVEVAS
jgi:hypothetical protein